MKAMARSVGRAHAENVSAAPDWKAAAAQVESRSRAPLRPRAPREPEAKRARRSLGLDERRSR